MTGGRGRAKGGGYPMRRGSPPPPSFFDRARPPAGEEALGLDLDDLRLEIEGLGGSLATSLGARYAPWAGGGEARPGALRVRLGLEDLDYFIEPPPRPEFNPVWLACDGSRVRFLAYRLAGWFDLERCDGAILLARGTFEPEIRALENFVRVAIAWLAAWRGGALVHGASAIREGRGYLFFGESGAGKSTLAASSVRGTIVSDDLTLLLPRPGGGLDIVGSPFRGTWEGGPPVTGRFPLVAAFRLLQSSSAAVVSAPRVVVLGQLVGNLTFVAEAFDVRPDLFASVERAFSGVPLLRLRFRRDDSFWDAIAAAGL